MLSAYGNFWKKYVDFKGKTSREDFWLVSIVNIIIFIIFFSIILINFARGINEGPLTPVQTYIDIAADFLLSIYLLVILIPMLSITVRRLRDVGLHWAFIFLWLVPLGFSILFVLTLLPSAKNNGKKSN